MLCVSTTPTGCTCVVNLRWRCDTMVRVVGPYSASSLVESVHVGSKQAW